MTGRRSVAFTVPAGSAMRRATSAGATTEPAPQAEAARRAPSASAKARNVRRVPTKRDEDQRAEEHAHEPAERRDGVQAPGDAAGLLDARHAEAHRVGRDGAEQQHRRGDQDEDGDERADERAGLDLVERVDADLQERPGHEGHRGQSRAVSRTSLERPANEGFWSASRPPSQ